MVSRYDVVIIGGGIAGVKAATEAKISNPSASVVMISEEPSIYARTALIPLIRGELRSLDDIVKYPLTELQDLNIKFLGDCRAISIDRDRQLVQAESTLAHKVLRIGYERLVIATGSVPAVPRINGCELPGVFTIKWFNQALSLSQYLSPGTKALVVGAGFIGLEVAEALRKQGMKVMLAVRSRILRMFIEPDLSLLLKRHIERKGVRVLTGVSPTEVGGKKRVEYVKLDDKKIPASIVVFATGVNPNVKIAKRASVKLGRTGAIEVNRYMQTSAPEIYAAGDCAEVTDIIAGKPVYRPLGSLAARTGEVAGSNAAGSERIFPGSLRRQYGNMFDAHIISMGLSTEEAVNLGISAEDADAEIKDPKHKLFSIKLPLDARMKVVIEKSTDTVIGWQVVGRSRQSAWYSLCLEEFIINRRSVSDLQELGLNVT